METKPISKNCKTCSRLYWWYPEEDKNTYKDEYCGVDCSTLASEIKNKQIRDDTQL